VGIIQGSLSLHVAFLEESVIADCAGDLVIQDTLKPGCELPRVLAGELSDTPMSLQKSQLDDI
jgi:hypothetical protein